MPFMLGRKPANNADLARAPHLKMSASAPPPRLDRSHVNFRPCMYSNDSLPDCSAAAMGNFVDGIATLNGLPIRATGPQVRAFYAGSIGIPDTEQAMVASDGAVLLDVLKYQATHGFNAGDETLRGVYATTPITRSALANSIAHLGMSYIGIVLYERDMQEPFAWNGVGDPGQEVGGHCVVLWDYTGLGDTDTVRIGTWGMWVNATWSWLDQRIEEAHVMAFKQLTKPNGLEWTGVTYDTLAAECAAFQG